MSAFLSISVWITLATVIPGLITITVVFWSIVIVNVDWLYNLRHPLEDASTWVWGGAVATIMVMTQQIGIILEAVLIKKEWLGPRSRMIKIPPGIDPHQETEINIKPYDEYKGLYILLAELTEEEDTHGHLQRAIAQFFLTNNALVAISIGIFSSFVLLVDYAIWFPIDEEAFLMLKLFPTAIYVFSLLILLLVTFKVARTRFEVMAKGLWAARRLRIQHLEDGISPVSPDKGRRLTYDASQQRWTLG